MSLVSIAVNVALILFGFLCVGHVRRLARLRDKEHREAMAAYASKFGSQRGVAIEPIMGAVSEFRLFSNDSSPVIKNIMKLTREGCPVHIFDYVFTVVSHDKDGFATTTEYTHTVVVLQWQGLHVPHFFCRQQRTLSDALGKAFGGQDIDFADDPAFSGTYVLQTKGDEAKLRSFMNASRRRALIEFRDHDVRVEAHGNTMVLHRGRTLSVDDLDALVGDALRLCRACTSDFAPVKAWSTPFRHTEGGLRAGFPNFVATNVTCGVLRMHTHGSTVPSWVL